MSSGAIRPLLGPAEETEEAAYDHVVADIDFPDDLVELERSAWTAIQDGTLTVETALAAQQGMWAFAEQAGIERIEVERGLKRLVRHSQPEADSA